MTTYYWESDKDIGAFVAASDSDAMAKIKPNWILLYKEVDTAMILGFVTLFRKK